MNDLKFPYTFRSVDLDDLRLLASWRKEPKVFRWFDDPDYLEGLEEKLEDYRIRMQLVLHHNEPIA